MIFRQLFDRESYTYTYLVADPSTRQALLIDPVREQIELYLRLLRELGLELNYVLDTHTHADHITGSGALRRHTSAKVVVGDQSATACADIRVRDDDVIDLGKVRVRCLSTPGHTNDSVCFLIGDRVFTGDTLLIRGTGRTDFQGGCPRIQYESLFGKLLRLTGETRVYPGHDYNGCTVSTIAEEKAHNPRLQVGDQAGYVELMNSLRLASPDKIDVAVPANLVCGDETPLDVT